MSATKAVESIRATKAVESTRVTMEAVVEVVIEVMLLLRFPESK